MLFENVNNLNSNNHKDESNVAKMKNEKKRALKHNSHCESVHTDKAAALDKLWDLALVPEKKTQWQQQ